MYVFFIFILELNQLLKHYGVKKDELSVRCEDIHLIAQHIEDWEALAPYLGLKERQHRIEIAHNHLTHALKTVAMLELWAKLNDYEATYLCLIEACLKAEDKELCGEICKIFMETSKCHCEYKVLHVYKNTNRA